ncbi:MAG: cell division protein FtsL [Thiomicrospira sp.]|jgi:cell division protein FtsL|nr:cell division protein FtsL [Thiomicrospira sp.]
MAHQHTKPGSFKRLNWSGLFAFLLLTLVAITWVLIVLTQHHIRHLETRYFEGLTQLNQLEEEWGRLMLEKNHLSSPARVERVAKEQLKMQPPTEADAIILPSLAPLNAPPSSP